MYPDLENLAPDEPATVIWCGGDTFTLDRVEARRDFVRLDEALAFIVSVLPLGRRMTAWTISGDCLIPPEGNALLCEKLSTPRARV